MKISLIIITYNRTRDLNECLETILSQTLLPQEIIIVDNGKSDESQNLTTSLQGTFQLKNINILFFKNQVQNSLTFARNLGIKNSSGDLIMFIDDDALLDQNYIREIVRVYESNPEALGVQGYLVGSNQVSFLRNIIYKLFFLYHLENNKCRALPSISATYPFPTEKVISCQWLSGANHSYLRNIFAEFSYDENLIKYSEGEDLELSHRVFLKYPDKLFLTPRATLIHKTSPGGRTIGLDLLKMREIYGLYIFYKTFYHQSTGNKLIFLWSRFGKIVINMLLSFYKFSFAPISENYHLILIYVYCYKHLKEIKDGNLEFFNKTIR